MNKNTTGTVTRSESHEIEGSNCPKCNSNSWVSDDYCSSNEAETTYYFFCSVCGYKRKFTEENKPKIYLGRQWEEIESNNKKQPSKNQQSNENLQSQIDELKLQIERLEENINDLWHKDD